jgi:hypothetical protein
MLQLFGIKSVLGKVVLARKYCHGAVGHKGKQKTFNLAVRAVALQHRLSQVNIDFISHSFAMASPSSFFHILLLYQIAQVLPDCVLRDVPRLQKTYKSQCPHAHTAIPLSNEISVSFSCEVDVEIGHYQKLSSPPLM